MRGVWLQNVGRHAWIMHTIQRKATGTWEPPHTHARAGRAGAAASRRRAKSSQCAGRPRPRPAPPRPLPYIDPTTTPIRRAARLPLQGCCLAGLCKAAWLLWRARPARDSQGCACQKPRLCVWGGVPPPRRSPACRAIVEIVANIAQAGAAAAPAARREHPRRASAPASAAARVVEGQGGEAGRGGGSRAPTTRPDTRARAAEATQSEGPAHSTPTPSMSPTLRHSGGGGGGGAAQVSPARLTRGGIASTKGQKADCSRSLTCQSCPRA